MDGIFAFLFKYRLFFFQTGDLNFQSTLPFWIWLLLALSALAFGYFLYRRLVREWGRLGWALIALRSAALLLLAFVLARPALVLTSLEPKESLLAVLIDNSASMGLPTADQHVARGEAAAHLVAADSSFSKALDERFFLRRYSFDAAANRLTPESRLDWSGDRTNIGAGLATVLAETRNLPLGGVVLVTDGADTASSRFGDVLAELKSRKIPVHTVGVGPESLSADVEVTQVSAPRTLLPDTVASARVTIRHRGFGGSRGRLEAREGSRLVDAKEIYFPRDSESFTAEITIRPRTEGTKTYVFSIQPLEGEEISENNSKTALIEVEDRRPRILYVEGQMRWEFKFIRRALADDEYVGLETLLRTAINKFYRQGIEDEDRLATGFPTRREDLFEYDAIIFGSLESAFLSYAQMEMVRDFVGRRGGGFLMLGGSRSFQAGKYRNTPIAEILPVWLEEGSQPMAYKQERLQVSLTALGSNHAALRLVPSEADNEKRWPTLPPLTDWNPLGRLKAGAVDLARIGGLGAKRTRPLLTSHRFGRGQAIALATGSTWHWQMRQDADDDSQETFWRQMMRWLTNTAKGPVTAETDREVYANGETVRIRAEVRDKAYVAVNDARVAAEIQAPSGETATLDLQWDPQEEGVYRVRWTPSEDGLHRVSVSAHEKGGQDQPTSLGEARAHFVSGEAGREYFDPVRKTDFLRKLAQETGGRYYDLEEADKLPEEIVYNPKTASVTEVRELWDMPINFFLLLLLPLGEWLLRKRQGAI